MLDRWWCLSNGKIENTRHVAHCHFEHTAVASAYFSEHECVSDPTLNTHTYTHTHTHTHTHTRNQWETESGNGVFVHHCWKVGERAYCVMAYLWEAKHLWGFSEFRRETSRQRIEWSEENNFQMLNTDFICWLNFLSYSVLLTQLARANLLALFFYFFVPGCMNIPKSRGADWLLST